LGVICEILSGKREYKDTLMRKEVYWFAIKHYYIVKCLFYLEKKTAIAKNIKEQ
jgi:hypothetical protein